MAEDLKNTETNKDDANHDFPGYPLYPTTDDIYSRLKEETEIDSENPTITKSKNEDSNAKLNEKDFKDDVSGGDLDVPGSELDDEQEEIGSEDEENNTYSLGRDNHK
ncbi:MAG: hypothetical protein Q8L81_11675 [Bacteroidota bacterium]|nr:hypothetical protein [Bacteroidota bacterium]